MFWNIVLTLCILAVVLGGLAFALLQLEATKDIIIEKIEDDFAQNYGGQLYIGSLDGLLPFDATLGDVRLTSSATKDSASVDTLATFQTLSVGIDIWSLPQNKLTINAFELVNPQLRLLADGSGSYTLRRALRPKTPASTTDQVSSSWIKNVEIVAPLVRIRDGGLFIERFYGVSPNIRLPEPVRVDSINAQMYVELTEKQRFLDIGSFTAQVQEVAFGNIALSGQVYNDNEQLEFNAFSLQAGNTRLFGNGTINGVDVYEGQLRQQLADATFNMEASAEAIDMNQLSQVFTKLPAFAQAARFSAQAQGSPNNIDVRTLSLGLGNSNLTLNGAIQNALEPDRLQYSVEIDTLWLQKPDAEALFGRLDAEQYRGFEELQLNGTAAGTRDSLQLDVGGRSSLGQFSIDGFTQLRPPYRYQAAVETQQLNIGPLIAHRVDSTNINLNARLSGQQTSLKRGRATFSAVLRNSRIDHTTLDSLGVNGTLRDGQLQTAYQYTNKKAHLDGTATANFRAADPEIAVKGAFSNLNLRNFISSSALDSTKLNADYDINLRGLSADRISGSVDLSVRPSVIGGDTVAAHQFSAKLDSPDQDQRTLQISSSLFDLTLNGDVRPAEITRQTTYWRNYFRQRIAQEIRFDSVQAPLASPQNLKPVNLNGRFIARDIDVLRHYLPGLPIIETDGSGSLAIAADRASLNLDAAFIFDTARVNSVRGKKVRASMQGRFRHGSTLKEFSQLNIQSNTERLVTNFLDLDSVAVAVNYAQDSLRIQQSIGQFSDNARFDFDAVATLEPQQITMVTQKFFLGNTQYAWQNQSTPRVVYNRAKEFSFTDFKFRNDDEYFAVQGTLSPSESDSLLYTVRDVNLGRISDLITGRLSFSGLLNGTVETRSITRKPSVEGNLDITQLRIDERLVGDVHFSSEYNEPEKRFDTRLEILTDSTKYNQYIAANDNVGQNIVLDGYVVPFELENTQQDSLFYFDADFNEIDMWAVQLVLQNIFNQLEGRATGSGYITGNMQNVTFNADFDVNNVYARPAFLNTNYYLDGPISLSSDEGVIIKDIALRDDEGGTGQLSGTVDLNNFEPITYLDLQMQLNDLAFLDSSYSPDVPFFGSLAGTGTLRLSGANTDMQLQSQGDIRVSQNSSLSIPLLEQTELNESNSFIQFVDSFDNLEQRDIELGADEVGNSSLSENQLRQVLDDLTFSERFNLDLQFNAPEPINVRLIFDPVTSEELRARGTGRLRISMQEGDVQMFGNYNVSGGSYNFVSGDIFSRQLDIRSGGSIVWEGPADNARLNLEAVYHARPSLSSITAGGGATGGGNNSQRVPVDLIVAISGTISSVENAYYFEVPNYLEATSNPTLQVTLNQINRDEQTKLLQATSILLTGNFLPSSGQGNAGQTNQLGETLRSGSTYINPLLSNQVLSPLLSSQVNALLNSDNTQFDIDLNLNEYNEIDLGIALRLYNDKLIFRREGYLTGGGPNSDFAQRIGDLNATYRLNPNLSITAFHRQDQTFSTLSPANRNVNFRPTVDGLGLEARVQFNTWQQLSHKVRNFFRRLFGKDEIDFEQRKKEQQEQTAQK